MNKVTHQQYRQISLHRRNTTRRPAKKRLFAVPDFGSAPIAFGRRRGKLSPDIIFRKLEDAEGKNYWGKRWYYERSPYIALTWEVEAFLATLDRTDLTLAVDIDPEFGLIYPYDEELFSSSFIVHAKELWRYWWYFSASERRQIRQLAAVRVNWPGMPDVRLGKLTDFQVTRTRRGLVFLYFEPRHKYCERLLGTQIPCDGLPDGPEAHAAPPYPLRALIGKYFGI